MPWNQTNINLPVKDPGMEEYLAELKISKREFYLAKKQKAQDLIGDILTNYTKGISFYQDYFDLIKLAGETF